MVWELGVVVLAGLLGLAGVAVARGEALDRVVGLQLVNVLATLFVVALAVATGRRVLLDVALVLAVLTLVTGLAYARFLERWL